MNTRMELSEEKVLKFMQKDAYKPLSPEDIGSALAVTRDRREEFYALLGDMESRGRIVRTRSGRLGLPEKMNLQVGILQGHPGGFGFVLAPAGESDLYIAHADLNGAMHGDLVIARIHSRGRDGKRPEGKIIRILKRKNKRLVGTYIRDRRSFVSPDEKRIASDILVTEISGEKPAAGDKVVVEITSWPSARRMAEGKIIERLGVPDEPGVDILSIIHKHHLPVEFPDEVRKEAERVAVRPTEKDIEGRLDLRDLLTVTIDGADARDFDDAISLETLEGGNLRLGVHIADVSHYVRAGQKLDEEALRRGTSVYLVDRVLPMLPPELSNNICSLRQGEDRLTLSVLMDFSPQGVRLGYRIARSVIRVHRRLTYDEVSRVLEPWFGEKQEENGDTASEKNMEPAILSALHKMNELAIALFAQREKRGSLDFGFAEAKVVLDEQGYVIALEPRKRGAANRLIEEFMVAANEVIAKHFCELDVPFVFRVHEEPEREDLRELKRFVAGLGYNLKLPRRKRIDPKLLQKLASWASGKKYERVVNTVILRSLKRARYAVSNFGHFGLAAEYYCHFTSPIRRYPDLIIHRLIKAVLWGDGKLTSTVKLDGRRLDLKEVAGHCSERERVAEEAERESVERKKLLYIAERLGEVYDGIISGVTSFGFFVELPNTVEGLVHVSYLTDDYYRFDERKLFLVGERTKRVFRIGDEVRVRVVKVNEGQNQIDFELVEEE